jgi:N6-adenosine-specific RNA methylase IME4
MTRYRCLLADPPWQFEDQGSRIAPSYLGHYQTMSLAEIVGLAPMVESWAATNAHLWLWAPNAFVLSGDAPLVMRLWGFRPVQMATWCKPVIGFGHWMRNTTEQLLLGVRGRLGPVELIVRTDFRGPRGEHSEKPEQSYQHIERVSPGPRLEMFARRPRHGWDSWGDQAPAETRIDRGEIACST